MHEDCREISEPVAQICDQNAYMCATSLQQRGCQWMSKVDREGSHPLGVSFPT